MAYDALWGTVLGKIHRREVSVSCLSLKKKKCFMTGMKSLFAFCLFSKLSCLLPNISRIKDVLKMKQRAVEHKSVKTYAHKTQQETSIFYSIQSVSLREKATKFWFVAAPSLTIFPDRLELSPASLSDRLVFGCFIKHSENKRAGTEADTIPRGAV